MCFLTDVTHNHHAWFLLILKIWRYCFGMRRISGPLEYPTIHPFSGNLYLWQPEVRWLNKSRSNFECCLLSNVDWPVPVICQRGGVFVFGAASVHRPWLSRMPVPVVRRCLLELGSDGGGGGAGENSRWISMEVGCCCCWYSGSCR